MVPGVPLEPPDTTPNFTQPSGRPLFHTRQMFHRGHIWKGANLSSPKLLPIAKRSVLQFALVTIVSMLCCPHVCSFVPGSSPTRFIFPESDHIFQSKNESLHFCENIISFMFFITPPDLTPPHPTPVEGLPIANASAGENGQDCVGSHIRCVAKQGGDPPPHPTTSGKGGVASFESQDRPGRGNLPG